MTKGEIRAARKAATAAGQPLTGELAVGSVETHNRVSVAICRGPRISVNPRHASRDEQRGRYIDCGPGAWDDR